jgi:hypothetical protein
MMHACWLRTSLTAAQQQEERTTSICNTEAVSVMRAGVTAMLPQECLFADCRRYIMALKQSTFGR